MSDAPERIFASRDEQDGWRWPRASKFPEQGPRENIEYRRADLPPTLAESLAVPEVKAMTGSVEKCLSLLDGLVAESGRQVEWGEEDPFRMGEWFDADDLAALATARAALRAVEDGE